MRAVSTFVCVAVMAAAAIVNVAAAQNSGRKALGLKLGLFNHNKSESNSSNIVCPPPGFDSVQNFNLSLYISAPWYVQKQVSTMMRTTGGVPSTSSLIFYD